MAVDEVERQIREATRAIRASPCSRPEACWGDDRWREPDAELSHYCGPCQVGTAHARRRHELRRDRQRRLDALRRACATFRRSIWGAAWLASLPLPPSGKEPS